MHKPMGGGGRRWDEGAERAGWNGSPDGYRTKVGVGVGVGGGGGGVRCDAPRVLIFLFVNWVR